MKKVGVKVLVFIYILIAIVATVGLFTLDEHNLSAIGNKKFVNLDENVGSYKKGQLLIIAESDNYTANDSVFYCELKKKKCVIRYGMIETKMGGNPTINKETISEKLLIGKDENVKVIPVLGYVFGMLRSRIGYLCVVVLPILVGFIYELFVVGKELKNKK